MTRTARGSTVDFYTLVHIDGLFIFYFPKENWALRWAAIKNNTNWGTPDDAYMHGRADIPTTFGQTVCQRLVLAQIEDLTKASS